ncbi:MAG: HD domain-containing protein [Desulfobacterales bacterium]|nr:HD domain-containing protein [Desulfobacterales bacterium]
MHSTNKNFINKESIYNSRIIDTYIKLVKEKYPFVNINEVLNYAKMACYEVADQGHWFTQEQINRFYKKLVELTGNENIAREAGRYAASPNALGAMRKWTLSCLEPANIFWIINKITSNFTVSSKYRSKKISANKVEITVTPREGVFEEPFQCENRIGFFESILTVFNYNMPEIQHTECMFKGSEICRYIISWKKTASDRWKQLRNYIALFCVFSCLFFIFYNPLLTLTTILPVSSTIILLLTLISENLKKEHLNAILENLKDSTNELVDQIQINYNNTLMTNEIGNAISQQTNIADVLRNVIQILEQRLDYDRCLILLANAEKNRLTCRAGFGYNKEQLEFFKEIDFHLDKTDSKGIFVLSFLQQKQFVINDINDIGDKLSWRSLEFAKKMGSQSFICCPIICDGESLGVLAVDNLKSKRPLVQSDMSLLMGIAPVIGISIRNAELLNSKVKQFKSIIKVMASSIDARDPLTAGHSEKVTEYALGICKELGLSEEDSEMIRVASLLHDYGKIGIPDSILKKKGRLTTKEYEIIKTHSDKTMEILSQINFEGIFEQVPFIAGSHHEKLDGSGYPKGLKAEEIPFGAKIIAVADFFEAITSQRHYRDPMPIDEAFDLLLEESNIHFDEQVVEAFNRYYNNSTEIRPQTANLNFSSIDLIEDSSIYTPITHFYNRKQFNRITK